MVHHRLRHLCDASPLTDSGGEDTDRVSCSVQTARPPPVSPLRHHPLVCQFTEKQIFLVKMKQSEGFASDLWGQR